MIHVTLHFFVPCNLPRSRLNKLFQNPLNKKNVHYVLSMVLERQLIQCFHFMWIYSSKFSLHSKSSVLHCNHCRSTPVESLHTILLGPYKYLLKTAIPTLSSQQKEEVLACIRGFNYSGFHVRVFGNVIRHHQSFVGRDYKAFAQMALFVLYPYLKNAEKIVWLSLLKV